MEKYLDCGNPRCGFARIRCGDCGREQLLTFSCKKRGFCPLGWAEIIKKLYEADPLVCPECQGTMRLIFFIEDHAVIDRIIDHLKLTFIAET